MLVHILILFFVVAHINAAPIPMQSAYLYRKTDRKSGFRSRSPLASVLPGDPLITGTLSQGVVTSVSLFSNVLLARFALSWFPQVLKQFPVLKPIITGLYQEIFFIEPFAHCLISSILCTVNPSCEVLA